MFTTLEESSDSVAVPGEPEMVEPAVKVTPPIVCVPLQVVPDGAVQTVVKAPPLIDASYNRTAEAPGGQSNGVAAKATAAVIRTFLLMSTPACRCSLPPRSALPAPANAEDAEADQGRAEQR
jgi:hypothetical protein